MQAEILFKRFSHDGQMAFHDLRSMCEEQGYDKVVAVEELAAAFNRLDTDGSGFIEMPEFMDWWRLEYMKQFPEPEEEWEEPVSYQRSVALKYTSEGEKDKVSSARKRFLARLGTLSGRMTKEEFHIECYLSGYCLTEEELDEAFHAIDRSGSGYIDFSEYLHWYRGDERFTHLLHKQDDDEHTAFIRKVGEYFRHYDNDLSGYLDRAEFDTLYRDLVDQGFSANTLESALAEADVNGDGNVSLNEFIRWWCSCD